MTHRREDPEFESKNEDKDLEPTSGRYSLERRYASWHIRKLNILGV
jgi:hypothetical protein